MEDAYQQIEVRIKNIFDPSAEEAYIRSVLEPDGWKVIGIRDDPGGQKHLVMRRERSKAAQPPSLR
jgi:hypothetical protein